MEATSKQTISQADYKAAQMAGLTLAMPGTGMQDEAIAAFAAALRAPLLARLELVGDCAGIMGSIGTGFGEEVLKLRAELASKAATLPLPVLQALRFYANGEHLVIDGDFHDFDTVSGEPQNWLMSGKDDDTTMFEDGSIARHVLLGKQPQWVDGSEDDEPPPIEGEAFTAAAGVAIQPTQPVIQHLPADDTEGGAL